MPGIFNDKSFYACARIVRAAIYSFKLNVTEDISRKYSLYVRKHDEKEKLLKYGRKQRKDIKNENARITF